MLAALDIRSTLRERQLELLPAGESISVRIGLNSGPVVVGKIGDNLRMDYTAVGDTTNVAARLQQLAHPDVILVSEVSCHRMSVSLEYSPSSLGKGGHMITEQKIVAVGAASGVAAMVVSVWILAKVLPTPLIGDALAERLAYTLRANVVAVVPFFIMLMTVGNARFLSDAIDPTRHAESRAMEIDGRVADNTLQQSFVFAVASLALSTIVPSSHLQVVWACAIVFVFARGVFWLGYRVNPLYRAPGMAATAYMNLGMILYVVFCTFVGL